MKKLSGTLVAVHTDENPIPGAAVQAWAAAELDGLVGERHRGFHRIAASYDRDPTGTVRRNERQWSAVSVEELELIRQRMDLAQPLTAETLEANFCVQGVADFSQLPRGSRLVFPSGAALIVEEENPPCGYIGEVIEAHFTTRSGGPAAGKFFPKAALGLRGLVGVVDVPGRIERGDAIVVEVA